MLKRSVTVPFFFITVLSLLFLDSYQALGLNGRGYAFAPEPARSGAIHGVGAVMKKTAYQVSDGDTSHEETLWRVVRNAIYIGDTDYGSVLLMPALPLMNDKGQPDLDGLKEMVVRFGPTVSSNQSDRLILREEYRFPEGTTIKTAPGFISRTNPEFEKARRTNALALVFLPYHFDAPLKPVPLIAKGTKLAVESSYLAFGHGNKMDIAENPTSTASDFELDKSSGYLRWVPMTLKGIYSDQGLLDVRPMPKDEQKVLFQSVTENQSPLMEGPCKSDAGAPLLISGTRLGMNGKDKVALSHVALIGIGYGFAGPCLHPTKEEKGRTSFIDLREAEYQEWISKEVPKLAR